MQVGRQSTRAVQALLASAHAAGIKGGRTIGSWRASILPVPGEQNINTLCPPNRAG
jgi:hypothetical protein